MKLSRPLLILLVSSVVLAAVSLVFIWRSSPPILSVETSELDRAILEKQAELDLLLGRSPEEEARILHEREVLTATTITEDVSVPGVRIATSTTGKVVRNESESYQITLPKNLVLARAVASDRLEFHDKTTMCEGDPSCPPVLRIEVVGENPEQLMISEWLGREELRAGVQLYSPREALVIKGLLVVKVTESLPEIFDGYYYYWTHGGKVYALRVSRVDELTYRKAINSLELLSSQ